MRLAALIELSSLIKNRKLNESKTYKIVNEGYNASLINKYVKQIKDNLIFSPYFCEDLATIKDHNNDFIEKSRVEKNRIEWDIVQYMPDSYRYDYRNLVPFEEKVEALMEVTKQFNFPKYITQYKASSIKLYESGQFTDAELRKQFNNKAIPLGKLIRDYLPALKLTEIPDNEFKLITLKESRSRQYKDALIFWENTDGQLIGISASNQIFVLIFPNAIGPAGNNPIYCLNSDYNVNTPVYTPSEEALSSGRFVTVLKEYVDYLFNQYCIKYNAPVCKVGYQSIKERCGSTSTVLFTDDRKRQIARIDEIGNVYAVPADALEKYTFGAENLMRKLNNRYYNEELPAELDAIRLKKINIVKAAKQTKEYIRLVDDLDDALDLYMDMQYQSNAFMKTHMSDKFFKEEQDSYNKNIVHYKKMQEYFSKMIKISMRVLNDISELNHYNSIKSIKNNYTDVRITVQKISGTLYELNSCIRALDDKYYENVFNYMKNNEPSYFQDLEWKFEPFQTVH